MFGFFLMASLIMLSVAAALIGNMNLFSDAMASGKHSDKNDKYQEDEKNYYSDEGDNKYSPDYNYYQYYQPMQQQEEQSGYNNNNYGYDIMTIKIKQSLITLVMRIIKNTVHIQQKTRNMSVKLDNLKVSTLNQLNFVN